MMEQIFGEPSLRQLLLAASVFIIFLACAWFSGILLKRAANRFAKRTKTKLDDIIISAIRKPIAFILVFAGLYLSLLFLPSETLLRTYGSKTLSIALALLGIYFITTLLIAIIRWYRQDVKQKKKEIGLVTGLLGPFRLAVLLFALFLAIWVIIEILGAVSSPITGWMGDTGWRIILIVVLSLILIIVIGEFAPKLVIRSLARRPGELEEEVRKRGNTLSRVLTNTGQVLVILITVFTILAELKINISPILASAGVVGIAVGFGAQSVIKDLIGGLFIILENQYRVGDVVRISGIAGLVEDINLRRTILRDLDGIVHIVPNGEIRVASNFTKEWSRVNMNISVAYGEDLDRVIPVINRVGKELAEDPDWAPIILKAPQVLRVDNLGDSGVEIKILGDTKPIRQWDVMGELRKRLKNTFDKEGIEIPWPHTKVYFGNRPPSVSNDQAPEGKSRP